MRNKKGALMALYMVVLTIFMCGVVVAVYRVQSKNTEGLVASPAALLKMQDNQQIFEISEKNDILNAMKDEKDLDKIKSKFIDLIVSDPNADFIFSDVVLNNNPIVIQDSAGRKRFLSDNNIYNFVWDNGKLRVTISGIKKSFILKVDDTKKINYPVKIDYTYSKTLICDGVTCS